MRGLCRIGRCLESVTGFGAARDSASQSCDHSQVRSVLTVCVFEKFAYVSSPSVQRFLTFREELVPLIHGRDS